MFPPLQKVVVGKGDVERVEFWFKAGWEIALPLEGMIIASEAVLPVGIPRTRRI